MLRLLEAWGYLDGWALTERGEVLARTYHECDLLVAEAMASGLLDGLDPAALAGLLSCFTYEHRGPGEPPPPWFPSRQVRARWGELERLAGRAAGRRGGGRPAADPAARPRASPRWPTPGRRASRWARCWATRTLSGGDFVRNVKTLIDLVRQVGDVAPDPTTARRARQAAEALHRGVVSISSTLDEVGAARTPAADGRRVRPGRSPVRCPRDVP